MSNRNNNSTYSTYDVIGKATYVFSYVFVYLSWCETSGNDTESFTLLEYKLFSWATPSDSWFFLYEPNENKPFLFWELMNVMTTIMVWFGLYVSQYRMGYHRKREKMTSKISMFVIYYFLWFCAANKYEIEHSYYAYWVLGVITFALMLVRVYINSRDVVTTDVKMIWS